MATIGGAVNTAGQIGGALAGPLVQSARAAFAGSVALVAVVCTVLAFMCHWAATLLIAIDPVYHVG